LTEFLNTEDVFLTKVFQLWNPYPGQEQSYNVLIYNYNTCVVVGWCVSWIR
jgi:hypothetical protein